MSCATCKSNGGIHKKKCDSECKYKKYRDMYVKERQGNKKRKLKYQIARNLGFNYTTAQRIRDFTDNHFILYIKSNIGGEYIEVEI